MVAQTRGGNGQALKFRDKLVGKSLSTDALLKKLKALHAELAALDQERVEVKSLDAVRTDLVNRSLLLHKDRGVKAFVACCLADVLRLYAPDAPYTPAALADIFDFFFRQLAAGLTAADAPYYTEYYHLLESLSGVKSVVLVCDLPAADTLVTTVFKEFFSIVRRELPKRIEIFMADILVALIDESQTLPAAVLERYLLPQFRGKSARMDQAAFRLAVQVCNSAADKLQRHVCQFFTDVIVEHAQAAEYDEIRAAHDTIKHLNRSCPALLHNVVPQLEEELRADDGTLRALAAQILGEMFADKGGRDLMRKYAGTWEFWLARRNDKDPVVRLTWVEATKGLIVGIPSVKDDLEKGLFEKLLDPDEKVRAEVCKVYAQLDYETALHHVSTSQLKAIADRIRDRKPSVRRESMTCLGKLYGLAYSEIENNEPAAIEHFAWIPQAILHSMTYPEAKAMAEQVVAEHILPLPVVGKDKPDTDDAAWTDRLLLTMGHLDEKAVNGLLAQTNLKGARPSAHERFVQACVDNNGGVIDEDEEGVQTRLRASIEKLVAGFADRQKAAEDLRAFAQLNEPRLYKLLRTCFDTQTDLKTLVKATADFRKRLEQSANALVGTMDAVHRRGSLHLVNTSAIPTLVKRVQRGTAGASHARALLTFTAKHCPALFQPHVSELAKALADEKNPELVEVSLQALAAVAKWDAALSPTDKRTAERVMRLTLSDNHRHAKFAARVQAFSKDHDAVCGQAVDTITDALPDAAPHALAAHMAALAQLATHAPDALEARSEEIIAFVVTRVLSVPSPADPDGDGETWVLDNEMGPELRTKLAALKLCRNRCLAHAGTDNAALVAAPVLKLLVTLLANLGAMRPDSDDDPQVRGRLRLQAAVSLLHLAAVPAYADVVMKTPSLLNIALTTQDELHPVRHRFMSKLLHFLVARRLPPLFNTIVFLTVHDPETEIPNMARQYVMTMLRALPESIKVEEFEMLFIRLLHLLAHHPDLETLNEEVPPTEASEDGDEPDITRHRKEHDHETLMSLAKYIDFFVNLVATADNISLLFHIASRAKTVQDAEGDAFSDRLYVASELAQAILKAKGKSKSWTIQSYPGKVKLPGDILRPLPSAEAQSKIVKKAYLPDAVLAKFVDSKAAPKARTERKVPAKRKAPAPKANGQTKRARRRKARESDDDDDDDDEESDDEDEDAEEDMDVDGHEQANDDDDREPPLTSSPREERLSRGARTRANAKIKAQTRPRPRPRVRGKADLDADDDD